LRGTHFGFTRLYELLACLAFDSYYNKGIPTAKKATMRGQMMNCPLTLTHVLDRARHLYGKKRSSPKPGQRSRATPMPGWPNASRGRPMRWKNKEEIYEYRRPRYAHMYLPDDVVFIESVPKTGVGKFDKKVLRVQFKDYVMPER
jgi:acyl-CoA synthetase (AMP-forming)/AMP-acid ligase II